MKFTGRRLEFCLACGGRMPDGSRIDRKYCRAACIERAYYQRHPDKKRVPSSRRLATQETKAGSDRSPDPPARQVQQSAQAHNDRRPPPLAGQARIAAPEPARRAAAQPTLPSNSPALAPTSAQLENAQLKQKLDAAAVRERGLREELKALREPPRPDAVAPSEARAKAPRQQGTEPDQARRAPRGTPEAREPQSLALRPHPPAPAIEPPDPSPSALPKPSVENLPRPPLLWEWSSSQAGSAPVPKWLNWTPAQLKQIQMASQTALAGVPAQMRKAGAKSDAKILGVAIGGAHDQPMWRKLSFAMVLRIACTDLGHRATGPQQEVLAKAALQDAIEALSQEGYPRAAELRQELVVSWQYMFRLALELVRACRDWIPDAG